MEVFRGRASEQTTIGPVIDTGFDWMLAPLVVCSFLVGYDLGGGVRRSWLHALTFAVLFSPTIYVIIDMEYPRVGLIRVTAMDRVLEDVRDSMR